VIPLVESTLAVSVFAGAVVTVDEVAVEVFALFGALAGLLEVVLVVAELQPNVNIAKNAVAIIPVEVLIFIR
jgi:hypothetical protein